MDSLSSIGSFNLPSLATGALVLTLFWLFLWPIKHDSREPPLIQPKIPIVGHMIGLMLNSNKYADLKFAEKRFPAHSLPMFGGKLYMINSPKLAESVIRNRNLSLDPLMNDFVRNMGLMDEEGLKVYEDQEFYTTWLKILYKSMSGQDLLDMNIKALTNISEVLNDLPTISGLGIEDLHLWVRRIITVASTDSLLGSKNPFRSSKLIDAYWAFEGEIHKLVMNPIPSVVAPKAVAGRKTMQDALLDYHLKGHDKEPDVPTLTRERMALQRKFKMSDRGVAAFELAMIHGTLFNTVLTTYWCVTYVFSQPDLVKRLRKEVSQITEEVPSKDNKAGRTMRLHINRIDQTCPLLMSSFRETQRITNRGTMNRKVLADTTISDGKDTFLLKEGQTLMVAFGVLHKNSDNFDSPDEFVADRFLKLTTKESKDDAGPAYPGFMPFGGGKHIWYVCLDRKARLCCVADLPGASPGRNFASGEIIGFLAMMLLGFELTDHSGGPISVPEATEPPLTAGIGKPTEDSDVGCTIRRRKGWENTKWEVVE